MKRKFLLICIIVMLALPVIAKQETDPIVGCWYANMDFSNAPAALPIEDYTRVLHFLIFEEAGDVMMGEFDFKGLSAIAVEPSAVGKWEKNNGEYIVSILAVGSNPAYIMNHKLYVISSGDQVYFGYNRMEDFNWYQDLFLK